MNPCTVAHSTATERTAGETTAILANLLAAWRPLLDAPTQTKLPQLQFKDIKARRA